ncbi:MAG TPA: SpoIIE family protein phosphatase [Vicinamibacteria bacterium]|jgi:serine phosphatase RsbU (regulator of sigma subunit)
MAELSIQDADGARERFPLIKERITIGRSRDSDIFLPDQWLSRHHAEIRHRADGYYLVDMGSKNGTLLNGGRINDEQRLRPGDVITLGEHVLTFSLGDEPEDDDQDQEPVGTQVFSAKALSDIKTKPAINPEELARQNRVLGVLSQAASSLLIHRPLPELFERVLDLLFEAVPAERGAILLLEGDPPAAAVKASRSRYGGPITKVSRSIGRRVLEQKVSLLLPNVMEDASFSLQESILSTGIRSAMCAPLWYTSSDAGQDAVIGLVYLDTLLKSHSFTEEDLRILTALANVAAAKIENVRLLEESMEKRRLEEDMRMAAEIQRGLLPHAAPLVPGYGLVGCNLPCRAVGGDYYDFGSDGTHLLFALGDVSGKGTGAALLMTVLRAAVRGHWLDSLPSQAMPRINRTVCENVPENKYVTFFMGKLDLASGRLTYVNAGHNPPILARAAGGIETLTEGGMVLGMFDSVPYEDGVTELRPGDMLVVYSDGVTETFNGNGDEFGEDRLAQLVERVRHLDAAGVQAEILREIELFAPGAKATDDRTLIVLKRN